MDRTSDSEHSPSSDSVADWEGDSDTCQCYLYYYCSYDIDCCTPDVVAVALVIGSTELVLDSC